ncbi:MAG: hypothetical protein ACLFWD_09980 [Anaerolineales bacterium]
MDNVQINRKTKVEKLMVKNDRKYIFFTLLIALSMVAAACAPQTAATDQALPTEMTVQSTSDLVSALNDTGVEA